MAVDLSAFSGKYSPETLNAVQQLLAAKPEQAAQFTGPDGKFDLDNYITTTVGWWHDNGSQVADKLDQFQPELKLLDSLGYQPAQTLPAEQALYQTILNNYINPEINGDAQRRTDANGIVNRINSSLDQAQLINREAIGGVFDPGAYLRANADVAQAFHGAADGPTPGTKMINGQPMTAEQYAKWHFDTYGKTEGRKEPLTPSRLDAENQQAEATAAALRATAAQAAQTRLAAAQEAAQTRLAAIDKRKADLTTALTQMQGDRTGALDAQTAQLREALTTLEGERGAALKQLQDARISAADTQVSGINQALESQKDNLTAQNAAKGFVGGSTAENAALVRAVTGARQDAAVTMGNAKVANATDQRGLGDDIANQRFGITGADATSRRGIVDDTARSRYDLASTTADAQVGANNLLATDTQGAKYQLATDTQAAGDKGTALKQTYFDNDFGRRLQSALQGAAIDTQRLGLLDAAGAAGSAGINRSLGLLNWFSGNNTPPTSNPYMTTPSQSGSDLAALGAGALGSAFNIANANNWWTTPRATTPSTTTTTGSTNPYSLLNGNNPFTVSRAQPFVMPTG